MKNVSLCVLVIAVLAVLSIAGPASAEVTYFKDDWGTDAQWNAWTKTGSTYPVLYGEPTWDLDGDGLARVWELNPRYENASATREVTAPTGNLYQYPRFWMRPSGDSNYDTHVIMRVGRTNGVWDYTWDECLPGGPTVDKMVINTAGDPNYASLGSVWIQVQLKLNYHNHYCLVSRIQMKGDAWGLEPVPEPSTLLALGIGLAGLAGSALRRKKLA